MVGGQKRVSRGPKWLKMSLGNQNSQFLGQAWTSRTVRPQSRVFSRVHDTLQSALFFRWSVSWSVGRSVTHYFFYDLISLTSLLLPKWSSDLKYSPCLPARDFGSRVSGLVFNQIAMLDQKNSTQTWSTDWLTKQPI